VFRYDGKPNSSAPLTKEVWIFGKAVSNNKVLTPVQSEQLAVDKPSGNAEATRTEFDRLMEMTRSSNAATRVDALSILADSGTGDQEAIRSDLAAELTDQNPEARSLAVQVLARKGDPETMNYMSQALRDPDLSVRIAAVESAPLKGEGLALLREALTDTDELIRTSARDRLQEAEGQEAD
jgi:HEAT repeats